MIIRLSGFAMLMSIAAHVAFAAPAFTETQICKAAISGAMGRDAATLKVDRSTPGDILLSYVRPNDGKRWVYKCKVEGAYVVRGSADGRWMNGPSDSKLTFDVDGDKVVIYERFQDGSTSAYPYTTAQLGKS